MADLKFVDQHNMVVCLEKTTGNSEFHKIVDFLTLNLIHHALTVSPTIYISYIEQFWNTASSETVNDEKQIHATVDSKAVVVTEASIRSSLLLNDADGTACLTNEAIFQNLALMGYEGELNKLTFQKALFSPQWKYLIHIILHCLSLKSISWNEFSTNIASAVICLATNQKFNFSKLIFNAHTQKVFSNMSRKGVKFSGKVTQLFDSMLVPQAPEGEGSEQPTEPQPTPSPTHLSTRDQPSKTSSSSSHDTTQDSRDSLEGTNGSAKDQVQPSHDSPLLGGPTSDRAEGGITLEELSILCTNLSNRVLALKASKDAQVAEIIKLKTRIKKLKKKSHPVISHHKAWLRSMSRLSMKRKLGRKESVSKQGRKNAKPFVPIGSAKEEELIKKMNEKATDEDTSNKEKVLEEPDSTKVEVKQEGHEDKWKYPLSKETLKRMLSLRLVAKTASEDAYTLLRFIQKHIDEHGSHDGGEKDL
ncbi:hypothetical protein Tco_1369251 [Tanacetum coccineum]